MNDTGHVRAVPLEGPASAGLDSAPLAGRWRQWNWALLDQALVSGTNFAVGILLVRYLGLEQYGTFVLGWMIVQFAMSIQNALIVAPMLSIAPKTPVPERPGFYGAALRLQALLVFVSAACFLFVPLVPASLLPAWLSRDVTLAVLACLVLMQLQDYLRRNLFSRLQSQRAFWVDLIAYGTQVPLLFLVVRQYPTLPAALGVIAAALLVSLLLGYRWLGPGRATNALTASVARRHWRSSKWLLGSAVLQWVSGNYFLIVCAALLGPAAVGAIKAAQNLLGVTHVLFQGLENIVPGEASQRYQKAGGRGLARYVALTALLMLAGTGLVALVGAAFAEPLLRVVYGHLDAASVTAMAWFVPIYMLVAVSLPLRAGLRTLESTSAIFLACVLTATFALFGAHPLIDAHGVAGAMAGMLVVEVLTAAVLLFSLSGKVRRS